MSAFDFVRPSKEYRKALFYYRKTLKSRGGALALACEALGGEVLALGILNNSAAFMWPRFFRPLSKAFLGPFSMVPNSVAAICCAMGATTILVIVHAIAQTAQQDLTRANLRVKGAKRGMQKARAAQAMQVAQQG